ncbi:hypothetical protein GGI15_001314 [Coemansia interrupta]|uniref:Uncharacterized protein n=1 Tax=Coemansia interrupta TaxID=1126814 RepID=A0A9W8LMN9_9FUNG|nr:hypothetical protein GGI15_001314 [Coemansia interrupta]
MFAALPRTLLSNPFDIIRKEIDKDVVDDAIVVGVSVNISDDEEDGMESTQVESVFGRDIEEVSDGECEYDPSIPPSDKPVKPAGNATVTQIQESLSSLFSLQRLAPSLYPFIYVCLRDFTVIFKMVPLADTGEFKRVAVISQSYLGLRRALRNAEVEFSLPLAPKLRSWNEIQHLGDNKADQLEDRHHLQSTTVDKTWRSALLVMGAESVDRVLSYLMSLDTLDTAQVFSSKPFVNGTMRKAEIRFSNALSYEDGTDSGGKGQRQAKTLYKADFGGIVLPNAWHTVLVEMAGLDRMSAAGFVVASKERFETGHLNMLVSKQGSAVTGKRNVEYADGHYTYY